jgi:hypothetical protein
LLAAVVAVAFAVAAAVAAEESAAAFAPLGQSRLWLWSRTPLDPHNPLLFFPLIPGHVGQALNALLDSTV